MFVDPKCTELAEHFLGNDSDDKKKELAEMVQWIVDLMIQKDERQVETRL